MPKKKTVKKKPPEIIRKKKELRIAAINLYWLTGNYLKVGKALGINDKTVADYVKTATDEEIATAKHLSNTEIENRIMKILDLVFGRIESAFSPGQRIEVRELNTIWGTNLDKLLILRGFNNSKHEHKHSGTMNFVFGDDNLKKEEGDGNS